MQDSQDTSRNDTTEATESSKMWKNSKVELGYLEECEFWEVESRLFPSKVGGKPAWLNLEDLPTSEVLQCEKCQRSMIFLCQIYAPFEEDPRHSVDQFLNNFHRTLFVFVCRNANCCERNNSDNIKVFRSCLQRANKFYSYDPSEDKPLPDFSLGKWVNLCNLCGCLAKKQCSKCKNVHYCTREHQILDWKEGHKKECGETSEHRKTKLLFHEWEIITGKEEIEKTVSEEADELNKFSLLEIEGKTGTMKEVSETDLDAHANIKTDTTFSKFQKRIAFSPAQVIRYERAGEPLWIAKEPIPKEIPDCEYCGGPRQFEFQIMPQMLAFLKENDVDWGVVVVYTCVASCTAGDDYKKEFVFKQDIELQNT